MSIVTSIEAGASRLSNCRALALALAADTTVTPAQLVAEVEAIRRHWGAVLPALAAGTPSGAEALALDALQTAGGDLFIAWEQGDGAALRPVVPAGALTPEQRAAATASVNAVAVALASPEPIAKSAELRAAAGALHAALLALV